VKKEDAKGDKFIFSQESLVEFCGQKDVSEIKTLMESTSEVLESNLNFYQSLSSLKDSDSKNSKLTIEAQNYKTRLYQIKSLELDFSRVSEQLSKCRTELRDKVRTLIIFLLNLKSILCLIGIYIGTHDGGKGSKDKCVFSARIFAEICNQSFCLRENHHLQSLIRLWPCRSSRKRLERVKTKK
jgi:hypothetical protein